MPTSRPLRYLLLTLDAAGNQPPMFGLGQRLQGAGHTVIVAGFASQQERVQRAGLQFALLEHSNNALMNASGNAEGAPDVAALIEHCFCSAPLIQHDLPALMEQHSVDRLLIDMLLLSAIAYVEATHSLHARSWIVVHTTPHALFPADGSDMAIPLPAINSVRAAVHLPPIKHAIDMFAWCAATEHNSSRRALVTSVEQLDPTPALLPPNTFDFIGQRGETHPTSTNDWQAGTGWTPDDTRPLILVSFHSSTLLDQRSRVERALQALADPAPYRVLATASTVDVTGLTVPSNALVVPFVPHHHVLPSVSAVVTHAGHGTVLAALQHGLPLLCLPNAMADQPVLAQHVTQLGVGLQLDGDTATPAEIRSAVDQLINDSEYKEAAQALAAQIKEASNKPLPC